MTIPIQAWQCLCGSYNVNRTFCTCGLTKPSCEILRRSAACEKESDLHDEIEQYCKSSGWPYFHSRMDMPQTGKLGTPDFIIALSGGKTLWLECKSKAGKETIEQQAIGMALRRQGHAYHVVRSMEDVKGIIEYGEEDEEDWDTIEAEIRKENGR